MGDLKMRMWMIHPHLLCNQHLNGEHFECHCIQGALEQGLSLDHLADHGYIEIQNLQNRHDLLAETMESRGMVHKTPMTFVCKSSYKRGAVDRQKSIKDLIKRCPMCRPHLLPLKSK
jgi:hypothetical protein